MPVRLLLLLCLLPGLHAEYATVNGVKLYYEVRGQGRPVVLLHGGMHSMHTSFAKQIPVLAKTHLVIAIDQVAHGRSPDVAGRKFSYEQMAEDTVALLAHLQVAAADFVGWSDGGQVALVLAIRYPKLVRGVFVSGVGLGTKPGKGGGTGGGFAAGKREYERVSPDGAAHWPVYLEKMRAVWRSAKWGFTVEELAKIQAPAWIVAGERDMVDQEDTRRIYRAIPGARLHILPDTGHSTFQERPEQMNAMLLEMLDRK